MAKDSHNTTEFQSKTTMQLEKLFSIDLKKMKTKVQILINFIRNFLKRIISENQHQLSCFMQNIIILNKLLLVYSLHFPF